MTSLVVNAAFIDRVKDRGEAEVFYEVYKCCIDQQAGQYPIYCGIYDLAFPPFPFIGVYV